MADERWDVPRTESGLQTLLARIEEARAAGDEAGVGHGLLALAFAVVWVRSDNDEPPFMRAVTLTDEALAIFRRVGDERGMLNALVRTSPFRSPEENEARLVEAAELAERLGDDLLRAQVLHARARSIGLTDREAAARMMREAIEIYRRLERWTSLAACLFGLCLYETSPEESYRAAEESARLYRESSRFGDAARSGILAVDKGEKFMAWSEMEPLVRQGLADAIAEVSRSLEAMWWERLAKVSVAKGDAEGAKEALDRKQSLETSDGKTEGERRRDHIAMTKLLIEMAKTQGNTESIALFEAELKRLRSQKPRKS